MNAHIEFIGPPGAGKSSIHQRIVENAKYYQGCKKRAIKQRLKTSSRKRRILYALAPSFIQYRFDRVFFQPRIERAAFTDFVQGHPDFLQVLSAIIKQVDYEPRWLYSACRNAAVRYQLGATTAKHDEILCLDESFLQRAVSILWRSSNNHFSLDDYFRGTPTPRIVIYIDAPADVCIKRQKRRGSFTASKLEKSTSAYEEQKRLSGICEEVVSRIEKQTTVIRINNVENIETAVSTTLAEIENNL